MDFGAALRLTTNIPELDLSASLRTNVNRECNAVGADDFEIFGDAFLVGAGLQISATASLVLEEGVFSDAGLDVPDHWDLSLFNKNFPLAPTHGYNTSECFVLNDDTGGQGSAEPSNSESVSASAGASAGAAPSSSTSPSQSSSVAAAGTTSLPGVPASTGTLYPAASAVPTWDFSKIESYYSASSQLPTNVNYTQMAQATTIPDNLKPAVSSASKPGKKKKGSAISNARVNWRSLLVSAAIVLGCVFI